MINTTKFISTILKDLLELPLVSDQYYSTYKVSRHIFSRYKNDSKLGKTAASVLKDIILDELSNDKTNTKEAKILNYMAMFLSEKEKQSLTKTSDIVTVAISKFAGRKQQNKLKILSVQQLVQLEGWSLERYHQVCMKMWDDITESGSMPDEHKGSFEQWDKLKRIQPDNFKVLIDGSEMIGFWDFLALFDEAFEKAKNGILVDSELISTITPYMFPGVYNIYVTSVMLQKSYQKSLTLQRLLFSILETFEVYALNGIFINEICAWAYSDSGIILSKSLGLSYIKEHEETGQIYCGKTLDLLAQPICDNFPTLKTLYYNQFRN